MSRVKYLSDGLISRERRDLPPRLQGCLYSDKIKLFPFVDEVLMSYLVVFEYFLNSVFDLCTQVPSLAVTVAPWCSWKMHSIVPNLPCAEAGSSP